MRKQITIDGKELEFEANAGTAILFKRAFKRDLLQIMQNAEKEGLDVVQELAYVMYIQTKGKTSEILKKANETDFFEWICQFSTEAFWSEEVASELINLWVDTQKATSTSKN